MSATDDFARFRERRAAERAARDVGRVTWRKVSPMTGGGWSGIGSGGRLVYVREPRVPRWDGARYEYGRVDGQARVVCGGARTIADGKRRAAALLAEPTSADPGVPADPGRP